MNVGVEGKTSVQSKERVWEKSSEGKTVHYKKYEKGIRLFFVQNSRNGQEEEPEMLFQFLQRKIIVL